MNKRLATLRLLIKWRKRWSNELLQATVLSLCGAVFGLFSLLLFFVAKKMPFLSEPQWKSVAGIIFGFSGFLFGFSVQFFFASKASAQTSEQIERTKHDVIHYGSRILGMLEAHYPPQHIACYEGWSAVHGKITEFVEREKPKKALLIQYSCNASRNLIEVFGKNKIELEIFYQDPSVPKVLKSKKQADLTKGVETKVNHWLQSIEDLKPPEFVKYTIPASLSAIMIDDRLLAIGWYVYRSATELNHDSDQQFKDDWFDLRGHDQAVLLIHKGEREFEIMKKMVDCQANSLRNTKGLPVPVNYKSVKSTIN